MGNLLPDPNAAGNYEYPDGSYVRSVWMDGTTKWYARFADGSVFRDGRGVISYFDTAEGAAGRLAERGEGPTANAAGDALAERIRCAKIAADAYRGVVLAHDERAASAVGPVLNAICGGRIASAGDEYMHPSDEEVERFVRERWPD